jgi:hypothetical protein
VLFPAAFRLTVLSPVFNDWEPAAMVIQELDRVAADLGIHPRVLLINDGSTERVTSPFLPSALRALCRIEVLNLHRNVGHQRALCIGITHIYRENATDAVIVMDGDGEDAPRDIQALLERFFAEDCQKVIFAARAKRMESLVFKLFYHLYRAIHRLLVGFDIRFGNFSILPVNALATLVRSSDLWNHYAAAAVKARLPITTILIQRASRLKGRSKMNFSSLVIHGLSAMSVYSETIGARILIALSVLFGMGVLALGTVIFIRLGTNLAIAGWTTMAVGLLLLLLLEILIIGLLFTFGVLATRGARSFFPLNDCPDFVLDVNRIDCSDA